jgi:hypothetical protein
MITSHFWAAVPKARTSLRFQEGFPKLVTHSNKQDKALNIISKPSGLIEKGLILKVIYLVTQCL